jgi:Protein of unknown function (DUF1091)
MMRGQFMPMQMIQVFIDQISKYGRLIVPCPIQPGHYFLKNAYIDETQIPMYRLMREDYVIILDVTVNMEVSGKIVQIYDMQAQFSCNKSNWP